MKSIFGGNKPKPAKGGNETYAQDVQLFHELNTRVRSVDAAVRSYERQISAITPLLKRLSETIENFYLDSNLGHGTKFARAHETILSAIQTFSDRQENAQKSFSAYIQRLSTLKKAVSEHDKLFEDMQVKEKSVTKAKPEKKQQVRPSYLSPPLDINNRTIKTPTPYH
eukprot:TRINITY_DN8097_c0_g1_i4.p1 TRINITY_DN8097_c0_g1~~TRINITY_DN8097_c0_g1_i4.p1  ORF type:complete len:168 (-),score=26.97 TRINITY_DN8097_c0_g1_i4:447-950(-)